MDTIHIRTMFPSSPAGEGLGMRGLSVVAQLREAQ
jgi:hypothetical protein